jgi:hypothetical protein
MSNPWSDVAIARWTDVAEKIVRLADEFPETRYSNQPTAEMRTFADQLRHIAFWNRYVEKTLRREAADGSANELPRDEYSSKQKIVGALQESFDAVKAELASGAPRDATELDSVISFVEHNGEHYGQLVVYYRLAGLIPPASR